MWRLADFRVEERLRFGESVASVGPAAGSRDPIPARTGHCTSRYQVREYPSHCEQQREVVRLWFRAFLRGRRGSADPERDVLRVHVLRRPGDPARQALRPQGHGPLVPRGRPICDAQ